MRIKALAAAAKEDEMIMLLDEVDKDGEIVRQFVMLPGRAVFPLDGMPMLDKETLLAVMDVPADKRDQYEVMRTVMNEALLQMMADELADDEGVERGLITISMNGRTMVPVISEGKAYFVGYDLLKVLADMRGLSIVQRMVDGSRVFVVMNGMMNVACLIPEAGFWSERCAEQLMIAGNTARKVFESWDETHPKA